MKLIVALLMCIALADFVSAELMQKFPGAKPGEKVQVESKTPTVLNGNATLKFRCLDFCFDSRSHAAFFAREHRTELVLFFPRPGYWTATAKSSSKQPIAIQG